MTPDVDAEIARQRAVRATLRATAQQLTAEEQQARNLMRSTVRAEQVAGYQDFVRVLARRHGIRVEYKTVMPIGAVAYSNITRRTIVIPPITSAERFAVALHEAGHIIEGRCPEVEPHRPQRAGRWKNCIACEVNAWKRALTLVPFFSTPMFRELSGALADYHRITPASGVALAELARVSDRLAYLRDTQRAVERSLFADKQKMVAQWRREASRW